MRDDPVCPPSLNVKGDGIFGDYSTTGGIGVNGYARYFFSLSSMYLICTSMSQSNRTHRSGTPEVRIAHVLLQQYSEPAFFAAVPHVDISNLAGQQKSGLGVSSSWFLL